MRRAVVIGCVTSLLVVAAPGRASARDLWAWIQELSGPGPLTGKQVDLRLWCFGDYPTRADAQEELRSLMPSLRTAMLFDPRSPDAPSGTPARGEPSPAGVAAQPASTPLRNVAMRWDGLRARLEAVDAPPKDRSQLPAYVGAMRALADAISTLAEEASEVCAVVSCSDLQNAQNRATVRLLNGAARQVMTSVRAAQNELITRTYPGAIALSACQSEREAGPFSLSVSYRWASFTDTDTVNPFAGGNKIRMKTLMGTFTWNPLGRLRNGDRDFIDVGIGVGGYSISSDQGLPGGFETLRGVIIEPRIDFRAPSSVRNSKHWYLALVTFQVSSPIFPAGFRANAFGPNLTGRRAEEIDTDFVLASNLSVNLMPLIDRLVGRR